ncbi:RlpA-like double-psi beta-barrel domain-containing protein [Longispora sp. NPDC051575]|uniref:RlpA-like double-psi beta-barrel domain-containing protein n=1 Tax=Longispora sp. NPDC051575 TaxID=3154943 RepID=UPI00343A8D58
MSTPARTRRFGRSSLLALAALATFAGGAVVASSPAAAASCGTLTGPNRWANGPAGNAVNYVVRQGTHTTLVFGASDALGVWIENGPAPQRHLPNGAWRFEFTPSSSQATLTGYTHDVPGYRVIRVHAWNASCETSSEYGVQVVPGTTETPGGSTYPATPPHEGSDEFGSGTATYYDPSPAPGVTGSCGEVDTADQLVVAVSRTEMTRGLCGRSMRVEGPRGTVTVRIVDTCGCGPGSIGLTAAAFERIADLDLGQVNITWQLL